VPAVTPWFTGAQVPLSFSLTDTEGNAQNATLLTSVTCTVYLPNGTTATVAVTNLSTGAYQAIYTTTVPGHHVFVFICTDATYPGAFSDSFEVTATPDTTIVSLAEAKEILHMTSTTVNDAKIQGYNAAITDWVEYVCGPVVVQTIAETLPIHGTEQVLTRPPVTALVAWTEVPTELAALGIDLPDPPSPMIRTKVYGIEYPLTQLYCDYERGIVTHTSGLPFYYCAYRWQYAAGRAVIPAGIYEATKIALKHLFMVETTGTGTGTGSGDEETTVTGFGFAVPNRALELLMPYSAPSRMVAI
jgi:hypothetical protein